MELLRYVCLGILLLIIRNLIKRILSFYRKFYSNPDYDRRMKNQVILCIALLFIGISFFLQLLPISLLPKIVLLCLYYVGVILIGILIFR